MARARDASAPVTKAARAPRQKPTSTSEAESRLTGAAGLRALACLNILIFHAYSNLNINIGPGLGRDLRGYFDNGAVGVAIFFVLSGMLLSYRFWYAYFTGAPLPSLRTYARRRASRILPGYYAALIVGFVVSDVIARNDGGWIAYPVVRLVSGLTLTSSFHYITYFPVDQNPPLWAIPMEAVSYLLLPLLMIGLFALTPRSRDQAIRFWVGVMVVFVGINQWILIAFPMEPNGYSWVTDLARGQMPGRNPIGFFGQFAIGVAASAFMVLWKLHKQGRRSWVFDAVAAGITVGIVAFFWGIRANQAAAHGLTLQQQPYHYPFFALAVATLAVCLGYSRWLWKAFDNSFLRFTAKYSYGIYLWHIVVFVWIGRHIVPAFHAGGMTNPALHAEVTLLAIAASYVAAMLSWRLIERPFVEGRFSGRHKTEAALAAP